MITLKQVLWSDFDRKALKKCEGPDWSIRDMIFDVLGGRLLLLAVLNDGERIGSILLRMEGRILFVAGIGGKTIRGSSILEVMPHLKAFAKANGFEKLECTCLDMARARLFQSKGFKLTKYVLEAGVE